MSISGAYTLLLSCDHPGCKELDLQIVRASRMEAKIVARDAGWWLPYRGRTLCPAHREARQEQKSA